MQARAVGLHLIKNVDLTSEALPFWTTGWRLARIALRLIPFVRYLRLSGNLLSVATTAHAMRGAAEYGELVFQRR